MPYIISVDIHTDIKTVHRHNNNVHVTKKKKYTLQKRMASTPNKTIIL